MGDLKEKKDAKAQEARREIIRKALQYGMLAALLGTVFLLPAYGVKRYVRENREGSGTEQTEEPGGPEIGQTGDPGGAQAGESGTQPESGTEKGAKAVKGTIVIDAGHGGDDPGMTGASGVNEKALNLVYAKKLQALLEEAGYEVVQTRDSEDGLYDADAEHKKAQDMQRRVSVIEAAQPLVTVSIHQNSYPQDSSVCGPQVFYFEQSGTGKELAACIQNCLNQELEIARPRMQKGNASYYILKRSASTTVIVECGFLTNPEEEAKLQDEAYQDRLTQAICDGVRLYLEG